MSYRLRWGLIPLALIPLALLRATLLAESDTFWQIRTGLDILRTHAIPDRDPYSWTAIGAEWHPNSWAFDVLLAIAYRVGDLPLVALAAAAFIPFIGWVVALSARRLGARPGVAAWVVVLGLILMVGWLSARPQLVDYAFAPAILVLLDVAVARRTTLRSMPALIGIGVAEAAWVNLHTAAPLGLGLIGCAGLGYALRDRNPSSVPTTAAALLSALLGCLASPLGWQLFGHVLAVRDASADIVEWGHVSLAEPTSLFYLALAVVATVAAGRMGSHPLMIAIGALTVAGAFTIRFLPVACVLGLPVFAASLSTWRPAVTYFSSRRSFLTFGLLALLSAQTAAYSTAVAPSSGRAWSVRILVTSLFMCVGTP